LFVMSGLLHCCRQDVDFEAQGLTENKEYLFRVAAANANGTGDWLEMPSPIIAKMPFGKRLFAFLKSSCFPPPAITILKILYVVAI